MSPKPVTAKEIGDGKKIVRRILAHHFGKHPSGRAKPDKPVRIELMTGGKTNLVFSVRQGSENLIVRLGANAGKINAFMKEQWAISKTREAGVPGPEVLEVSNDAAPVPYMISRQSAGTEATDHPERLKIVRRMGELAARIHSIRTRGFGNTFDWSQNQLSQNETWGEFLRNELKLDERLDTLADCGNMESGRIHKLRSTLLAAAEGGRGPALNHGDLRLKNVLADEKGEITCLLDWEHATSSLAPEWDLSIALHDFSIDEKQAFLEGCGVGYDRLPALSPILKALNLINYAPALERASRAKNTKKLDRYRARIAGEMDLYSL